MPVPKCAPCEITNSEERALQSRQGLQRDVWWQSLSALTPFTSRATTSSAPPPPALSCTHISPTLPALVSIATKQKPTGFAKAANLPATIQKGEENSLGNSGLTLAICPQRSASPSGGPGYQAKNWALSSPGHNSFLLLHPPFLERKKPEIHRIIQYVSLQVTWTGSTPKYSMRMIM